MKSRDRPDASIFPLLKGLTQNPLPTSPTENLFLPSYNHWPFEAFRQEDLFVQCRFSSSTKEEKNIYLKHYNRLKDVYFYQYV